MDRWPDSDGAAIDRYLATQHWRHPSTRRVYGLALRAFQRFSDARQTRAGVAEGTLVEWVERQAQVLSTVVLCNRMTQLNRFLDDLVQRGSLAANPFAALQSRHSIPHIGPLVRALAAPDRARALAAARVPVHWGSPLGPMLREHVETMQTLGYRYQAQEGRLRQFDRFLQDRPELSGCDLATLMDAFRGDRPTSEHLWASERLASDLSYAWSRAQPAVSRHRLDRALRRRLDRDRRRPHVYSPEEIERLLTAALAAPAPRSPLVPATTFTMVALAYSAGLRIGEIVRLLLEDVRLEEGVLLIRNSKFFKSRRIPLHPTAIAALRRYLSQRQASGADQHPSAPLFWQEARFGGYSRAGAQDLVIGALRRAALKPARGKRGPRIHDLRHTFVVHRLLAWYREGRSPEPLLPFLATYLGHRSIHSTLIYITVTRELMAEASERFRAVGAAHLRADRSSS